MDIEKKSVGDVFTFEGQDQRIKWKKFKCIVCGSYIIDKPKRHRKVCGRKCHNIILKEVMTGAGVNSVMVEDTVRCFMNCFAEGYSDRKACKKLNISLSTFNNYCDSVEGFRKLKEFLKKKHEIF